MASTTFANLRAKLVRETASPVAGYEWVFDTADGDDDWADGTSGCTVADDGSEFNEGGQAIKATTNADAQDYLEIAQTMSAIDLSDKSGVLQFHIPDGTQADDAYAGNTPLLKFVDVFLVDSGAAVKSQRVYSVSTDMHDQWHSVPIHPVIFTGAGDLTDITKIRLKAVWNDQDAGHVITFDHLAFYAQTTARVFFRFDDALVEGYGYCNVAKSYGFTCSLGIVPSLVDTADHLTLAQLRELHSAGHHIWNHTSNAGTSVWRWTDGAFDTIQTLAERRAVIGGAESQLLAWDMPEYATHVIVPGGGDNPGSPPGTVGAESDMELIEDGTVGSLWYTGASQPQWASAATYETRGRHEWCLRGKTFDTASDADAMKAMVQEAIDAKADIYLNGHKDATVGEWDAVCAFVQEKVNAGTLEAPGIASVVQPQPVSITDNLLMHLKLDGGVTDETGLRTPALVGAYGASDFLTGKFGQGLQCDGVGGNRINCGTGTDLKFTTESFTLAWYMYSTGSDATARYIISNTSWSAAGYTVSWKQSTKELVFKSHADATNKSATKTTLEIMDGWHHIAIVRVDATVRLYVDAVETAWSSGGTDHASMGTSGVECYVGSLDATLVSKELLDDVRIYGRGLSASDIKLLLNPYTNPAITPGVESSVVLPVVYSPEETQY